MSAVKCETGDCPGFLLPKLPTVNGPYNYLKYLILLFDIPGSPWSCLGCGKTVGVSKIHSIVNSAVKIIGTKRDEDNEVLLETIEILEQTLHQNHYLIIGLKEIIIQRLMRNIRKKTGIYEKIKSINLSYLLKFHLNIRCPLGCLLF